jgi:hypothetical protein
MAYMLRIGADALLWLSRPGRLPNRLQHMFENDVQRGRLWFDERLEWNRMASVPSANLARGGMAD